MDPNQQQMPPMPPTPSWDRGAPAPAPIAAADPDRRRRWLTGLLGIAGGYIVLANVAGQLPYALTGQSSVPVAFVVLMLAQSLFGIALVVAAYVASAGPLATRGIAAAIFVIAVVLIVVLQVVRVTMSVHPLVATIFINPYAWLVLAGGFGWLLASRARPVAYASLLATILLFLPVGYWLVIAGVESGVSQLVLQVLSLIVAAVIIVVGAKAGARTQPQWGAPV